MEANDIKFEVPSLLTPEFIEQPEFDPTKVDTTPIQEMNNSGTIVSGNIDFGNYNQPADLSYFNISKSIGQTNDSSFLKQKFSGEQTLSPYKENTLPQPKPKMTGFERMALNEASPEDFELNKSDKLYKFGKKGLAKAGDFLLGALGGDFLAETSKNAIKNKAFNSSVKVMGDKGTRALKDIDEGINKLTKSDFRDMLELAQTLGTKEQVDAIKKCIENPSMYNELKDVIGPMANFFAYHQGLPTIQDPSDKINRNMMNKFSKSEKLIKGIGAPVGSFVGAIMSPLETLSNLQDKKIMRDTKIKVLESLPSTLGDMSSKTDKELDNLIRIHSNEIRSMYSK